MAAFDAAARRGELREHARRCWARLAEMRDGGRAFAARIERWEALLEIMLDDERFVRLAEPVTGDTVFRVAEYAMRYDGVHVFPEIVLRDDGGEELVVGNAMRLPYDETAPRALPYRCPRTERIFGVPVKPVTSVSDDRGVKSHVAQLEETEAVRINQEGSRFPIEPWRYMAPVHAGAAFRREEFLFTFPVTRALRYMIDEAAFEPVVRGTRWLLEEAHLKPYADFEALGRDDLAATGSTSFGDEEDKEDFDIMFLGDLPFLRKIRDFIYGGTRAGDFRPFQSNFKRRLRVIHRGIVLDCTGEPILFCPFLNLKDPRSDRLYRARITDLGPVESFEARVVDDDENMICPSRVVLDDFDCVRADGWAPSGPMPLILMHGSSRGQFARGNWLRVLNARRARIEPEKEAAFEALLSTGWMDVDLASW